MSWDFLFPEPWRAPVACGHMCSSQQPHLSAQESEQAPLLELEQRPWDALAASLLLTLILQCKVNGEFI